MDINAFVCVCMVMCLCACSPLTAKCTLSLIDSVEIGGQIFNALAY